MESIRWNQYSGINIVESIQWNQYSRIKINNYLFIKVFQQNFVLVEYLNLEPGALTRARANLNLEPGALTRARANLNLEPGALTRARANRIRKGDVGLIELVKTVLCNYPRH